MKTVNANNRITIGKVNQKSVNAFLGFLRKNAPKLLALTTRPDWGYSGARKVYTVNKMTLIELHSAIKTALDDKKIYINGSRAIKNICEHVLNTAYYCEATAQRKPQKAKAVKPLAERLSDYKVKKVETAFYDCNYRYFDLVVKLRANTEQPSIQQYESWDNSYYSKSWHSAFGGKKVTTTYLGVTDDWFNLKRQGLAICDGLLNLQATKHDQRGVIEIYRAKWLTQKRGYDIVATDGYIATNAQRTVFYHADTPEKAENGFKRKIKVHFQTTSQNQKEAKVFADMFFKNFDELPDELKALKITKKDASDSGLCKAGVKNFLSKIDIEYDNVNKVSLKALHRLLGEKFNWKPTFYDESHLKILLTHVFSKKLGEIDLKLYL